MCYNKNKNMACALFSVDLIMFKEVDTNAVSRINKDSITYIGWCLSDRSDSAMYSDKEKIVT